MLRAAALAVAAAAPGVAAVDCEAEVGTNCALRLGPADQSQETYDTWAARHEAWRRRVRAAFEQLPGNFSAYDDPAVAWARTDWVEAKTMFWDAYLYDRTTRQWTVDRYLDDLQARYGGVDSVTVWQFYPNSGVDDRNQYDMLHSLPGGADGLRQAIAAFHARGVRVFVPVFPWDVGTRGTGRAMFEELTETIIAAGGDGVNGDTTRGMNLTWWDESVRQGHPLVLEPEWFDRIEADHGEGFQTLGHNVMSWGQNWGGDGQTGSGLPRVPYVAAAKALEPRHWVHLTNRWATNRTNDLQTAFFNGIGYLGWESVWCIYNQFTQRHGEELRRIRTLYKGVGEGLLSHHEEWHPHVPYSLHDGVYASEFRHGARTMWLLVNPAARDVGDAPAPPRPARAPPAAAEAVLSVPCAGQGAERYFDLWRGEELTGLGCAAGRVRVPLSVEGLGYGAVLRTADGSAPAAGFLADMRALAAHPLSSFDADWRPLQQTLRAQPAARKARAPRGTALVPGSAYRFRSTCNAIGTPPGGDVAEAAVDVQFPWEDHPRCAHDATVDVADLYVDVTLTTNAEYAHFVAETGWRPADAVNWLRGWDHSAPTPAPPAGDADRPAVWLSRDDAAAYCSWRGMRLPEAWEWQHAAQGGDAERRWPWGDDDCAACAPRRDTGRTMEKAAPVGAHPLGASPHGLQDMVGNVYQWTSEFRDEHAAKAIVRGGSHYEPQGSRWYFPQPRDLLEHNTLLLMSDGMDRSGGIGVRCVADAGAAALRGAAR